MSWRSWPGTATFLLVGTAGLLGLAHLWLVSGGRWTYDSNPSGTLYARQATAFRAGQLALLDEPPAELLVLPDPYDPREWRRLPIDIDVSLYAGRFYLYFGPTPALAMVVLLLFSGTSVADGMVGLALDLVWVALLPVCVTLLRRRIAPRGGQAVDLGAVIAIGLSAPVGAILSRLATYETAILAGQAFLALGLTLGAAASGRAWLLSIAGLAFGLASASRLTLLPALAVLAAVVVAMQPRSRRQAAVTLGASFAGVLVGLALFNAARFGSPFETGWQYQLTALPQRALLPAMFGPGNLVVTANWHLTRLPEASWAPPWLLPRQASAPEALDLATWFYEPNGTIGVLWSAPLLALGGVAALGLAVRLSLPLPLAGLWVAAGAAALPVLLFRAALFRYQLDFLPLLLLAAALSLQRALPSRGRSRALVSSLAIVLAFGGAAVGLGTGIIMRNARAGFTEAEGLVATIMRRDPVVEAVTQALGWVAQRLEGKTTALIVEPLPGTPATIDVGSPPEIDVVVAAASDPCWGKLPGPGVDFLLSTNRNDAQAAFAPRWFGLSVGPTVFVAPRPAPPPPLVVSPDRRTSLCPIAGEPATVAEGFAASHFRRYRTRAFWAAGSVVYQPVASAETLVLRLVAHGARERGGSPKLILELRERPDGPPIASQRLSIDQDWSYASYERAFDISGTVYPALVFDGPAPSGPWWAIAVASLEAWLARRP